MEVENKSIYKGQFCRNTLVMGETGCGKTYFFQKLGFNKCFGKLVKIEWVAGIKIDEEREAETQSCFSNKAEFHVATEPDDLVSLIEKFKLRTRDITSNKSNSVFGEQISMNLLIVMDDVLGIPDNCKKLLEFLTVYRKYRYHCIDVFHIIMAENKTWKNILSQTNIFNIFPSSVPYNTVAELIQSNCRQTTKKYVPAGSMRLNRFFIDLANSDEQHCSTTDCNGVNKNSPGRYRISS